jgi:hypothetical protein
MDAFNRTLFLNNLDERLRVVELMVGVPMSAADKILAEEIDRRRRRELRPRPRVLEREPR